MFEFSGVSSAGPGLTVRLIARLNLVAARKWPGTGENSAVYNIQLPGNEFTIFPEVNGKIAEGGAEASESYLFISKDARVSGFSVQMGKSASDESPSYYVMLRGSPNLFSTLYIPQNLPPVAAYSEATIHFYDSTAKIDTIRACAPESFRSSKSSTDLAASSPEKPAASSTQMLQELLIAPRCFQLSGVSWEKAGMTSRFTARITLGGVVANSCARSR